jgi:SAM-dependent methyltransferase
MSLKTFYNTYPYPNIQDSYPEGIENYSSINAPKNFDGSVFVIGCGTSEAVIIALQNPVAQVYAIDISETSLDLCAKLQHQYDLKNLILDQQDITTFVSQRQFDIAVSSCVLHHIPEVDKAVLNIYNSLTDTGSLQGCVYSTSRPKYLRDIANMGFKSIAELRVYLESNPNEWYMNHLKNDEELADAFLNPYWVDYDFDSLTKLFSRFKERNFVLDNDKIHFQCIKDISPY